MSNIKLFISAMLLSSCELSGSQPAGYEAQIDLAEQLLQNEEYDRSYDIYDEVSSRNSRSATVQLALYESYFNNRAFLKSEKSLEVARDLGAEEEADLGLGRIYLAKNQPSNAIASFNAVLARHSENTRALNGLGVAYDLLGNHSAAQGYYHRVLEMSPGSLEAQSNLGLSLILSGNVEEATILLSDLITSDLNNPVVRQNLALSYHALGRPDDAMALATVDINEQDAASMFSAVERYRGLIP